MTDFIAIPAITILCYMAAELYKAIFAEPSYKNIPAVCGMAGIALGIACHYWAPGYIPAENALAAAAVGALSGWAATGANQALKQWLQ